MPNSRALLGGVAHDPVDAGGGQDQADDREAADEVECQAACADRRRHHRCHRPQIRETSPALAPDLLARSSILTVLRPGQLDQELSESSWLVADIDAEFLFNPPASELWKAAIKRLGANPAQLQQGHGVH